MTDLPVADSTTFWAEWLPIFRSLPVRLLAGLVGAGLLAYFVPAAVRRRVSPLPFLLGAGLGLTLGGFALFPDLLQWFVQIPYLTRLRLTMGLLSFLVLSVTMESLRKDVLEERYALLWVATSVIIFAFALFPKLVVLLRVVTGVHYTSAVLGVLIAFLLLVAFHFSLALSIHRRHQSAAARKAAVLDQRVTRLEELVRELAGPEKAAHLLPPPAALPCPSAESERK